MHHFPLELEDQLKTQRKTVDFDTFDISAQQLLSMLASRQVWIPKAYQRQFRWGPDRCSQFIESLLLGIPIPSLFMATNPDNTWEVVDGVQRLSTLAKFAGDADLRAAMDVNGALVLQDLGKLSHFVGLTFEHLPPGLQLHFYTRPLKVITLNDKSDTNVRFDVFERLNTGGVTLSAQEIRDCVYRGAFAEKLDVWAKDKNFQRVVRLTPLQQRDATGEECVLRFFAFRDRYKRFTHEVKQFLNDYMKEASADFDYSAGEAIFVKTFTELARVFQRGIRRPGGKQTTPLNLYEGIAVGASFALDQQGRLHTAGLDRWMASDALRKFTTGATNDRSAVIGRIEFCRDRFLGKP